MSTSVIDVALIGVGPMAAKHAAAIASTPGIRLVSCASRDIRRAEAFASQHEVARPRLIKEVFEAPQADALWIVAPATVMADAATHFSSCELPMFLEKPVGLCPEEVAHTASLISVPHMIGLNRRYYEILQRARTIISDAGGLRAIEVHLPERPANLPSTTVSRLRDRWAFANSIHMIDLFRFFAGEPEAVHSEITNPSSMERGCAASLRFANGAIGVFHSHWYAPGGWRLALYAENLSLVFQPIEQGIIARYDQQPAPLLPTGRDLVLKPGLAGQAAAFRDLVRDGNKDEHAVDLRDYCKSVSLTQALTEPATSSLSKLCRKRSA